jgi:hypothetical protein
MEGIAWLLVIGAVLWFGAQVRRGYRGEDHGQRERAPSRRAERSFNVEVVGESNYQAALERICGGRSRDGAEKYVTATLVPEDSNPYDENAVRVDIDGVTVGYLSRHAAKAYRKRSGASSGARECAAVIRGGWERGRKNRGDFGVRLELS